MIDNEALTPTSEQWAVNAMPETVPEITRELAVTNLTTAFAAGSGWQAGDTAVAGDPAEAAAAYAERMLPPVIVATVTPFMAMRWLRNAFADGAVWQEAQQHEAGRSPELVADLTAWWDGHGSADAHQYIQDAWGSDDPELTRMFRDAYATGWNARNARNGA